MPIELDAIGSGMLSDGLVVGGVAVTDDL